MTVIARTRVAIVGSGFSGLGMAIRLKQSGMDDFVVLERRGDVGGTWRDNTYPGAACDVPSHLYSFSFAPNPTWSRSFSSQPEIQDYLRRCADDFGIRPHLRTRHVVLDARWDDQLDEWHVETDQGTVVAQFLVAGVGALSEPSVPAIPGLDSFAGVTFHSAAWNHEHDLRGERVAVIGTGASAIQFVPQIAPDVARLDVYQRTPPWIVPRWDRAITPLEQKAFAAVPALQRLARAAIYWGRETYVLGFTGPRRLRKIPERLARKHLAAQVNDPVLRAKLTPDYTIGCKRILISSDYYPALARPNVDVITTGVREIREHAIVTADGTERKVDTIIFGTGFHVTDFPAAQHIRGRGGRLLADAWQGGMQAYAGTTVAGFPNLFLMTGPNTGLGHTSMVFMIESQTAYVLDALQTLADRGASTFEVRPEAQTAYNEDIQRRMRGTVWTSGGCASWYLDERGRNTTLWPGFTWEFRRRVRRFDEAAYVLAPGPAARAGGSAIISSQPA